MPSPALTDSRFDSAGASRAGQGGCTFFRFHRNLLNRLPALAWQSVLEVYRAIPGPHALPGGIIGIQTFGSLLHSHPHLHGLSTDGAFTPEGHFLPVPVNLTHEPFLRLWEHKVFRLLLDENLIAPELVTQMRSWRHSGFHVDRSVLLARGDRAGIESLGQYIARSPFSLARLIRVSDTGNVLYKADKEHCQNYPEPASEDLFRRGGAAPAATTRSSSPSTSSPNSPSTSPTRANT